GKPLRLAIQPAARIDADEADDLTGDRIVVEDADAVELQRVPHQRDDRAERLGELGLLHELRRGLANCEPESAVRPGTVGRILLRQVPYTLPSVRVLISESVN